MSPSRSLRGRATYAKWSRVSDNMSCAASRRMGQRTKAASVKSKATVGAVAFAVVAGALAALFAIAVWGYDPQRGLVRRKG